METDGHADVDFEDCDGEGDGEGELRCEVVKARAEEEGGDEGWNDDYAVECLAGEEGGSIAEEEYCDEGFEVGRG